MLREVYYSVSRDGCRSVLFDTPLRLRRTAINCFRKTVNKFISSYPERRGSNTLRLKPALYYNQTASSSQLNGLKICMRKYFWSIKPDVHRLICSGSPAKVDIDEVSRQTVSSSAKAEVSGGFIELLFQRSLNASPATQSMRLGQVSENTQTSVCENTKSRSRGKSIKSVLKWDRLKLASVGVKLKFNYRVAVREKFVPTKADCPEHQLAAWVKLESTVRAYGKQSYIFSVGLLQTTVTHIPSPALYWLEEWNLETHCWCLLPPGGHGVVTERGAEKTVRATGRPESAKDEQMRQRKGGNGDTEREGKERGFKQNLCVKYLGVIINYSGTLKTAIEGLREQSSAAVSEDSIYQ
ncbi:hypothetical protein F2P81_001243 [Scophthalmus maximus]|uniref:Uncharacterized protein n=1 Tax=Scophthalmus maximus TaxID=52904 RepID=A0A6A4TVA7_SCOMX|nr:hypothetical protein F2P81_001243 [Scophthalmus maximus]